MSRKSVRAALTALAGTALLAGALLAAAAVLPPGTAAAQEATPGEAAAPAPAADARLQSLLDEARRSGTPVIVLPAGAAPAGAQSGPPAAVGPAEAPQDPLAPAAGVRRAIGATVATAPQLGAAIAATMDEAEAAAGPDWPARALLLAIAALGLGAGARLLVLRATRPWLATLDGAAAGGDRVAVIASAIGHVAALWLSLAAFLATGIAVGVIVVPDHGPVRWTAVVAVVIVALYLLIRDVFATLFSPSEPARRLVRVDDATARAMLTRFLAIGGAGCALFFTTTWLGGLGLAERPGDLMRIVSSLSVCVLLSAYVVAHRRTVAGLIRGGRPGAGLLRSALASLWHVLIVGYLVVATGFNVVAIVAGEGFRVGPVLAPLAGFFVGFLVHGLAVIVIDRRVRARRALLYAASGGSAAGLTPDGSAASVASGEGGGRPDPITVWQARWQACGERIAAVGAFVVGLLVTLAAAGLLGEGSAASKSLGLVIIAFLAYAVYQAMLTWIDGRIADEDGPAHVDSEDGMGPGASRLATLLPLLRSVLGVTVFTVAGMVALSAVGVNVGPLFAGAGIVGLAIGFGAQSLIRDIFSGVFFLADDAFRRGEYIAVGSTTGSVERISLRSFQLRHHNGPLHTIPFGNIDQLTNFSRDWAIMKLKLRLEYGADIEKVRKMIKKLFF